MTLIVYREGRMAADSMETKGNIVYGHGPKIYRLPDGGLFGACGSDEDISAVLNYLRGGDKPTLLAESGFGGIIARPHGEFPFEIERPLIELEKRHAFLAIGEQQAVAMAIGAMHMGASAERAVEIAIENCVWIGGDVQVETL